jgi:alpha-beta hydrolase superfamily lysophospholipase
MPANPDNVSDPKGVIVVSERAVTRGAGALHIRTARAPGEAAAILAVLPGYGDHSGRYLELMRWMAARGVTCHALDFRGHGKSAGRRGFVKHWDEYLDDLKTFLKTVAYDDTRRGTTPTFLLGHSHGALVAAAAAVRGELSGRVNGCVLVSPYFHSLVEVPTGKEILAGIANVFVPWMRFKSGLAAEMMTADPAMIEESRADTLLLRTATPRWYFGMRKAQRETMEAAGAMRMPLLTFVGTKDTVADPRSAATFSKNARSEDKDFAVLDGRRHELLRETDRFETFTAILDWMRARAVPAR